MVRSTLFVVTCTSALFASSLQAQTLQRLSIDEATVFLSGAELISSATVALSKGENEILFANVAGDVNGESLIVNATNGAVVEAATFQNNYLANEVLSPKAQSIKDSIELLRVYKKELSNRIDVLNEQIEVLKANRKVGGNNTGLSVAELSKMLDLVNTKMDGYLNQKSKQEEFLRIANVRQEKLTKQLEEEQNKGFQPGGQLLVKFYVKEPVTSAIHITYVVPHAGWTPTYDIMADDANGPVKLFYKANIYQNSGVKWNNVRLSLSTGNPNEGAQAPVLTPWYLAFYLPQAYSRSTNSIQALGAGTQSHEDVYEKAQMSAAPSNEISTMNQYVSVDNSGINTSFDIDIPYTIPSDGQQHLVAIKRYELPATYRYYAVPKLDKDAFLQAQVTNCEDLNLLPGQTNIFYEGSYVGKGNIDVRNIQDTMTLSLGRDKKIVVKRERDTKLRSVKTIGTNVRETFAYSITVRNTRKENINLIVQDQLPVSNDKDIVIEDRDTGDATVDETTGMLKWTLTVNPNETKKLTFGYTIKYPKGKSIANLQR